MVRKLETGKLYVIATPIGNTGDVSKRCIEIFNKVHCIAAEDTRNSSNLLSSYNVKKQIVSFHEHNELKVAKNLIKRIQNGNSIALISDAGTPCISDPGYRLVSLAHENGITVSPIPGPSSIISSLS
ncbi:MAG: SAM-dependent methyltransferase, partial [Pseudomonadota bacterium]|nr:SAM-dependent methyltransferase [Pseudomonadota bacterium]